jgi:hypothetical protein
VRVEDAPTEGVPIEPVSAGGKEAEEDG